MTTQFEPRPVPAKSCYYWLKEALALSVAKPILFVVFIGIYVLVSYVPIEDQELLSKLMVLCTSLLIGAICIFAEAIDTGRNPLLQLKIKHLATWISLILVGLLPLFMDQIFEGVHTMLNGGEPVPPALPPNDIPITNSGVTIAAISFSMFYFITGPWTLFTIPLIVNAGLPFHRALMQSFSGLWLNWFVLILFVALPAITMIFSVFTEFLVFPVIAIIGCMQYVAYRHIWLGRLDNQYQQDRTAVVAIAK